MHHTVAFVGIQQTAAIVILTHVSWSSIVLAYFDPMNMLSPPVSGLGMVMNNGLSAFLYAV